MPGLGALKFDHLRAAAAPLAEILRRSDGTVTKPETFDLRGFTARAGGPFDEKIFGATIPCVCRKEKPRDTRIREALGTALCAACGATPTANEARRTRLGRVALTVPVAHPFFREEIAAAAGLARETLDAILATENWVCVEDGAFGKRGTTFVQEQDWAADSRPPMTGGPAVAALLEDTPAIDGFAPRDWMLNAIPILPPGLRPMKSMTELSDADQLYRRLINRNDRLRRLLELNAPEIILRNEIRMAQEGIDATFDNERQPGKIAIGGGRAPLESLLGAIGGLEGVRAFLRRFDDAISSGDASPDHPGEHAEDLARVRAMALTIALA